MSRRGFLQTAGGAAGLPHPGERLYNGIELPAQWPPPANEAWFDNGRTQMPVPYLVSPPRVIPIDIGRQLFVDDFLIEESALLRRCHEPERYGGNPIIRPERDYEQSAVYLVGEPVLWDPQERRFKLWYAPASWIAPRAMMVSGDGIRWRRPRLGVSGASNIVLASHSRFAICSVLLDHWETDPSRRFKVHGWDEDTRESVYCVSPEGVHWRETGRFRFKPSQDTTNIFHNPFRRKWIYNPKLSDPKHGRTRMYAEAGSFAGLCDPEQIGRTAVKWYRADEIDDASPDLEHEPRAQIYDLFAVPYESLMIGAIGMHYGPPNDVCREKRIPKLLQIHLGYSRDGFHWHRPAHEPFIRAERGRGQGHPEFGYLRPAGSVLNVVGDKLRFYYQAASGIDKNGNRDLYTGITIQMATLRRDGFVSLDAPPEGGIMTTRPVVFQGRFLFVNVDCPRGELRVELLDEKRRPIPPFSASNCLPVCTDSTTQTVIWADVADLSRLRGRPVRFRFHLRTGSLYAFWVSGSESGASGGYLAGGGPGFAGPTDTVGRSAHAR